MGFFPTSTDYMLYAESRHDTLEYIKQNTKASESLGTVRTIKPLIGRVDDNGFALISSEIGIGAFTVIKGYFEQDRIKVDFEINKPFRVLICIMAALFCANIIWQFITKFEWKTLGLVVPTIMFYFFLRFIARRNFRRSKAKLLTRLRPAIVNYK